MLKKTIWAALLVLSYMNEVKRMSYAWRKYLDALLLFVLAASLAQSRQDALGVLKMVGKTYCSLKTLRAEGDVTSVMSAPGMQQNVTMHLLLTIADSGRVRMEGKSGLMNILVVSDGEAMWLYMPQLKKYAKFPLNKGASRGNTPAAHGLPGLSDIPDFGNVAQGVADARILRSETLELDGVSTDCYVISVVHQPPERTAGAEGSAGDTTAKSEPLSETLWVDKARFLVVRSISDVKATHPGTTAPTETKTTITFYKLALDEAVPDDTFVFKPPQGATEMNLEQFMPQESTSPHPAPDAPTTSETPEMTEHANTAALLPPAAGSPQTLSQAEAFLQRGALTVWVPKSYALGRMDDPHWSESHDYPWSVLLNEFRADFPHFDLHWNVLQTDQFRSAFHRSTDTHAYPDVAFVDNYSELGPLIDGSTVLTMLGPPRFEYRGWWVMFKGTKNLDAAKSFMLWLSQSPHWKPWKVSTTLLSPADVAAVQAISRQAIRDLANASPQALRSIMDSEASHFDGFGPNGPQTRSVTPLVTFGNSRLAFVLLAEVSEGEKTFGMAHSAAVLRNAGGGWKVLVLLPRNSLPELDYLLSSFDRLGLEEGQPATVPKVTLLAPADHAQLSLFPRSNLEWRPVDAHLAAYVLESQVGQQGREYWSPSTIRVVSPVTTASSLHMEIPFGVGAQPHRWRVWAINKNGIVSISDWRIIDFTN